jgi:hypothetical protein
LLKAPLPIERLTPVPRPGHSERKPRCRRSNRPRVQCVSWSSHWTAPGPRNGPNQHSQWPIRATAQTRKLPMTPDEFRRHGRQVIDWIADYMERVEQFPVLSQVVRWCSHGGMLPLAGTESSCTEAPHGRREPPKSRGYLRPILPDSQSSTNLAPRAGNSGHLAERYVRWTRNSSKSHRRRKLAGDTSTSSSKSG